MKNERIGKKEKKILKLLGRRGRRNEDQLVHGVEGRSKSGLEYSGPSFPVMDSVDSLKRKGFIRSEGRDKRTGLEIFGITNKGKIAYFDKIVRDKE